MVRRARSQVRASGIDSGVFLPLLQRQDRPGSRGHDPADRREERGTDSSDINQMQGLGPFLPAYYLQSDDHRIPLPVLRVLLRVLPRGLPRVPSGTLL